MSKDDNELYQKGLIITDDVSVEPILDFKYYKQVITDIIKKSYPKFSIGVFGEWGTGKTTLMKSVYNELSKEKNNSTIPVWFNAWRYERENQFALFPLLQTIAKSIPEKDENKKRLKEAVGKFGRGFIKGFIKSIPEFASAVLPSAINEPLKKTSDNIANEVSTEFMSILDKISQSVIDETLYSTEIGNIEQTIREVRKKEDFKIVVFIDDLDRCSPNKALEVLESIKVFLDLDGFIFVIGLSRNKISQLITAYYKEKYKEIGIEGEQYLKKIIQIPINLPIWNANDIEKLVTDFIDKGIINSDYKNIIKNNVPLISTAIEYNPREIKRFLNNFIIIYELFKMRENFNPLPEDLLLLQAIQLRWNTFYGIFIISDKQFRSELKKYVSMDEDERNKIFDIDKIEQENERYEVYHESSRRILKQFKTDFKLWELLSKHQKILEIENLEPYRRANDIVKDVTQSASEAGMSGLLSLLRLGRVEQFNEERLKFDHLDFRGLDLSTTNLSNANFSNANFSSANLSNANLSGAYLSYAILSNAILSNAILSNANLYNSNLSSADLSNGILSNANLSSANLSNAIISYGVISNAILSNSDLSNAILSYADLSNAKLYYNDLSGSNLSNANLSNANLSNANLSNANLSNATLFDTFLSNAILSNANLSNAILSNTSLYNANFSNTDLSRAILINLKYNNLLFNGETNFTDSIIDDLKFLDYIKQFTNQIPNKIENKRELKYKLEERKLNSKHIQELLQFSKLPD